MQVFKIYFKIIKANIKQISIYLIVFLVMGSIFSHTSIKRNEDIFNQTKTDIAFINLDEDTYFTKGFKEYLSKYANFVEVKNEEESLQDALYYRDVEYILTIPKDFTKDFLDGKDVEVEKTIVPNSTTTMYLDMAINKYLNKGRVYAKNIPGITEEDLGKELSNSDFSEMKVTLKSYEDKKQDNSFAVIYFNYLAYSLFAMLILGVSSNLMVFNNKNIKRRNICSPMKDRTFNMQFIAANLIFAFACCLIMIVASFIFSRQSLISYSGLLLCINALVFTVVALSISYLVGLSVNNRNAQSAISNVLSLGLCFLSGVFVPQEFLSDKCLAIASFTPTYWYVKANNVIGTLSSFTFNDLKSIITYMLIEIAFAIAIFSIALVVSKQMRITNS